MSLGFARYSLKLRFCKFLRMVCLKRGGILVPVMLAAVVLKPIVCVLAEEVCIVLGVGIVGESGKAEAGSVVNRSRRS